MRRFFLSLQARSDLSGIWDYFARELGSDAADEFYDQFLARFEQLTFFPLMGRDRSDLIAGVRSFRLRRYLIFYREAGEGIEVVRVLHGSRDIETVFFGEAAPPEENA